MSNDAELRSLAEAITIALDKDMDSDLPAGRWACIIQVLRLTLDERDVVLSELENAGLATESANNVLREDIAEHEEFAREFIGVVEGLQTKIEGLKALSEVRLSSITAHIQDLTDRDAELLAARGGSAEAERKLAAEIIMAEKFREQFEKAAEREQLWKKLSQEQSGKILARDETIMALRSKLQRPTFDGTATT